MTTKKPFFNPHENPVAQSAQEWYRLYSWMWANPAPTLLPYQNYTRPKLEPVKEKRVKRAERKVNRRGK